MIENILQIVKLGFTLGFRAGSRLPSFVGNTIRGAFGASLSRQCCVMEKLRCDNCDALETCAYGSMFKVQNEESVPNPYVISAPYPSKGDYGADDTLDFSISLFGTAHRFENDVIRAAESMCNGTLRNAVLEDSWQEYNREWSDSGAESIEFCDVLDIRFLAPAELRSKGEALKEISFEQLIDSLFGRIADIIDNYTNSEFVLPYSLLERKPYVKAESQLESFSFSTNSQPIEAVMGSVRYFGDVTRYLPYIDLGTQLHIGKKTTRGCGEYTFMI